MSILYRNVRFVLKMKNPNITLYFVYYFQSSADDCIYTGSHLQRVRVERVLTYKVHQSINNNVKK